MAAFITGVLAFIGAGVGSALAYLGTRRAIEVERTARRREEWGRRFTAALQAVASSEPRRRGIGRDLLVVLMSSEMASEEDRRQAAAVLDAAATLDRRGSDLRELLPADELDQPDAVADNESAEHDERGDR
jgi:hypothetical protein